MGRPYHHDFYGWAEDQADALRRRSALEIDWENLLDEVQDLAGSMRRELKRRLMLIIQHLLKWRLQPDRRSKSWSNTILIQRREVEALLEENPSLRSYLDEAMRRAISLGAKSAAIETDIKEAVMLRAAEAMTFDEVMTTGLEDADPKDDA